MFLLRYSKFNEWKQRINISSSNSPVVKPFEVNLGENSQMTTYVWVIFVLSTIRKRDNSFPRRL